MTLEPSLVDQTCPRIDGTDFPAAMDSDLIIAVTAKCAYNRRDYDFIQRGGML